MQELKVLEASQKESSYKILSLIFGILIICIGLFNMKFSYIIIGAILMFCFTYSKTIYLTNFGIEYRYKGFLFNRTECLSYSSIDEINVLKGKTQSSIFIIKEPMAKKIVVANEIINDIINYIKDNSNVIITYNY